MSTPPTRWQQVQSEDARRGYAAKFARYADEGTDLDGEARFVDMLAARNATILDAGCGTGRVTAAIAARGHTALGVDADPLLIEAGHQRFPGVPLHHRDLLDVTPDWLAAQSLPSVFDVIVAPGNVMVYLAPGTEPAVLEHLHAVLRPGGRAVFGFATDREYTVSDLDRDAAAVGWRLEQRFATWHLDPWHDGADWSVSVFRRPGQADMHDGPDGRWSPAVSDRSADGSESRGN